MSKLKIAAAVSGSFTAIAIAIIAMIFKRVVTFQMGLLMLVALVGLYVGFGVLFAVWRFIDKLE
jgi:hypothetical protein